MVKEGPFQTSIEVEKAFAEHRPVVALESAVIAHGLPFPDNLNTALRLEQIVRDGGAIPATIAVLGGRLRVGITPGEVEHLARAHGVRKVSRRDLALAIAGRMDGATTVAATMWIARKAGIEVFATGGIGGVHRGNTADVSADLPELARTPMIVVCSGPKIVLDLGATREWLETHGVAVLGYGCDEMPAFYSRESGFAVDQRVETAADVARIATIRDRLGVENALLVTLPVPASAALTFDYLNSMMEEALAEATRTQMIGRELTPFLLRWMNENSDAKTLRANVALLENNSRTAAEIAVALRALDGHASGSDPAP